MFLTILIELKFIYHKIMFNQNVNYKTVFFTLGLLQIILGLSMIIPIATQFIYNELDAGLLVQV